MPKKWATTLGERGSHLERYAALFPAVEINSSFYRHHRPATYARWAASVPADFRFAVKAPREVTHLRRLKEVDDVLERFLAEVDSLGSKLGPVLVQLPPSLRFNGEVAKRFLDAVRQRFDGLIALEPRHATWFSDEPTTLLREFRVARVAADPAVVPAAAEPAGWTGLEYHRLHGSPKMYHSPYSPKQLGSIVERLRKSKAEEVWCIFDNTADGAATDDALHVWNELGFG